MNGAGTKAGLAAAGVRLVNLCTGTASSFLVLPGVWP